MSEEKRADETAADEIAVLHLTEREGVLLIIASQDTLYRPDTFWALPWLVEDQIAATHPEEHAGVDGPDLVRQLRTLSPTGQTALCDAIERVHDAIDDDQAAPMQVRVREIGLVRDWGTSCGPCLLCDTRGWRHAQIHSAPMRSACSCRPQRLGVYPTCALRSTWS